MKKSNLMEDDLHSEDLQEIIAKPPSWLLKRGISLVLGTVLLIIGLSVFIRFPEMVGSSIKFNSVDAPKVITSRVNSNLTKLLIKDGEQVSPGTALAYLESTAEHSQVIMLLQRLQDLRTGEKQNYNLESLINPKDLNLGELQGSYQNFYLAYLNYRAASQDGIYQKRKGTLQQEKANIVRQYGKVSQSFELQQQQLKLAEEEFVKYRLLAQKKVISPSELQEKEALLLVKRQTIPQMENNLIGYEGSVLSKNKELTDLDNQINEERKKFVQALNSFISEAEIWKRQYILTSPVGGKLIYGAFLQENQPVKIDEPLFYVNPNSDQYYGEVLLSQNTSAKVKKGQQVLIKVRSFPYQEYGYLHGKVDYISDIPMRDSVFFIKVSLIRSTYDALITLKPGIYGDAEIITEDKSVFRRIWDNLTKNLRF
ncbi:MAG: HlyD family secretion protein [Sphingobacterium sp.]|jgi:HlyD family secretion protein|uniref:HlyD family efflux transporter periplasmic adaptor subunit n=1 Tax=Sphingobacterium sp. TaxID=341027 RepID=UPI00284714CB|nr:HlyD family efflux transporter periplasmic adaptor subunit [Sphingobacterium sp.]MDR3010493.1 HlyD family secretion protein [Sphingobacterium sp.]